MESQPFSAINTPGPRTVRRATVRNGAPASSTIHIHTSHALCRTQARHTRPALRPPTLHPARTHGGVAGEAGVQRRGHGCWLRERQQPPARPRPRLRLRLLHGLRRSGGRKRQGGAGAGGRVQRGAARVRGGVDAGVRRGDGRGPADEDHPDHHHRRAAAAGGAPHRQLVLLLRLRVLRGGERDGMPVLGGGAGGVPEPGRHGARHGGRPAGAGAALLGRGRRRRVRHPGRARQLARALG